MYKDYFTRGQNEIRSMGELLPETNIISVEETIKTLLKFSHK